MTAAEAMVQFLKEEGVRLVFGYPGGAVLPIYEALRGGDIRHVLVRQEQAAVHSANGYARITGEVFRRQRPGEQQGRGGERRQGGEEGWRTQGISLDLSRPGAGISRVLDTRLGPRRKGRWGNPQAAAR